MVSWEWCRSSSMRDSKNLVFILKEMTVFIGNCMETEHRFLGTPCTKTESAFSQGVVFFRLRPGKVMKSRFSFCNCFPREARDDLTQPTKLKCTGRSIGRSIFQQVPKPHNSASVWPSVCSCKLAMRLKQSTAKIPGCLVCGAGVPDESVSEHSQ